jgi:hypothetical protein
MASTISDFFGYKTSDTSDKAQAAMVAEECPILGSKCEKTFSNGVISGVCAIKPMTSDPVICCPIRLYGKNYQILRDVCDKAFEVNLELFPGKEAVAKAIEHNKACVAVFGKKWGGELRLPQRTGAGRYFVDWVLAKINSAGELEEFVAVEVQTIDTTGNYQNGYHALRKNRTVEKTSAGLNWENVSKRILPQLIYKGQILQREELCKKGLFFISPKPVYERIMKRLGGKDNLIKYALQPASISFIAYDYSDSSAEVIGKVAPIMQVITHSTTVYKVQEAFNNVTLPEENVYRDAIIKALSS